MDKNQIIDIEPIEVTSSQASKKEKTQVSSEYIHMDEINTQTPHSAYQQSNPTYNVRIDTAQMHRGPAESAYASTSTSANTPGRKPSRFSGLVFMLIGVLVALIGIPLLILPGPGLLVIGAGLALIVSGAKRLFGVGRSSYNASAGGGVV